MLEFTIGLCIVAVVFRIAILFVPSIMKRIAYRRFCKRYTA